MPVDTSKPGPILIPRSNLETIDRAFYNWAKKELEVSATYPDGWKTVPILWTGAERSHQSKADVTLRDEKGNINLPVIVLERLSVNKEKRGAYYGNILADSKGGTSAAYQISRKINQAETTKYSAAKNTIQKTKSPYNIRRNNNKVVYETYTIPQPVHVNIIYKIRIKAQFQQQINEILTPILKYSGQINGFMIGSEPHRYEAFFPASFDANNNAASMGDSEKAYETTFDLRVLGYLLNDDKNSEYLEIEKRQSIVEVRMPRERIMIGDTHPNEDDGRFYKE
jgi:hypothetical protein